MALLLDKRWLYAVLFTASGVWLLGHGVAGRPHLVGFGAACLAAGLALFARRRWGRLLGCGLIGLSVAYTVVRAWVLLGEPVTVGGVLLELFAVLGLVDLARADVTREEEAARAAREAAAAALEAGRRRAQLAHLLEHLEAVEESVRELHERQGHALPWEACEDAECAALRRRIETTRGQLEAHRGS